MNYLANTDRPIDELLKVARQILDNKGSCKSIECKACPLHNSLEYETKPCTTTIEYAEMKGESYDSPRIQIYRVSFCQSFISYHQGE